MSLTDSTRLSVIEDVIRNLADKVCALENREAAPYAASNKASAPCNCVVKRTEVAGMGIIYARADCPTHGLLHGARC
jgi:hypothetical protein